MISFLVSVWRKFPDECEPQQVYELLVALLFSISTAQHMSVQQGSFWSNIFNRTAGARRKRDKLKKGKTHTGLITVGQFPCY